MHELIKKRKIQIRKAQIMLKHFFDEMNEYGLIIANDGTILACNKPFSSLFKISNNKMLGKSFLEYIPHSQSHSFLHLLKLKHCKHKEFTLLLPDAKVRYVYLAAKKIKADKFHFSLIVLTDINPIKIMTNVIEESEKQYRELTELSPYGIMVQINNKIVYANHSLATILGSHSVQELINKPLTAWLNPKCRDEIKNQIDQLSKSNSQETWETQWVTLKGQRLHIELAGRKLTYQNKPALQIIISDVTKRKKIEDELEYIATHDVLTGLFNRTQFEKKLNQALVLANESNKFLAVLFINIDRFKLINDIHGHRVGDQLLQQIADYLLKNIREYDTVARLGGDEFVVLLTINNHSLINLVTQKILNIFKETFIVDDHAIKITTSIGVSVFPDNGLTVTALLEHADIALHKAKEQNPNSCIFFTDDMAIKIRKKVSLESELHKAFLERRLDIYFQPIVCLKSGNIVGAEALLRWFDPSGKEISPAEFIPIAEESGLIVPLGNWVLEATCQHFVSWQEVNTSLDKISVNLSYSQLQQNDFLSVVNKILKKTGILPQSIMVELTENIFIANISNTIETMNKLHQLGITLAIDDFGTGYSSLSHLKHFNVDELKIDLAFIRDIGKNKNSESIILATIAIAHALNAKVVAEGVETEEQINFLIQHHCDLIQGYYVSKPISPQLFLEMLSSGWNLHQIREQKKYLLT